MRILREAEYQRRLKEEFERGLSTGNGYRIQFWMYQRMKESNRGVTLSGYDVRVEADRILKERGFD